MAEVNLDVAMQSTSEEILAFMELGVVAKAIKSIQKGTVSWSEANESNVNYKDVTINAVDPSKCIILNNGHLFSASGMRSGALLEVTLINETTVRAYQSGVSFTSNGTGLTGYWTIIELNV